jgi:hypothetical protein
MAKHTPEPWRVNTGFMEGDIWAGSKRIAYDEGILGSGNEEQKANADRIVACVNACGGIDTAELADGVIKAAMEKGAELALGAVYDYTHGKLDAPGNPRSIIAAHMKAHNIEGA